MERRYLSTEVRATGNQLEGLASVTYQGTPETEFQLWDNCVERVLPDAFDIQPDCVCLFNHNQDFVLGRTPNTLKLRQDEQGLHYTCDLPDTTFAKDLKTSIARGDIKGSSFAFVPQETRWVKDGNLDVRQLVKVKVYDVSPCTTPAYSGSQVKLRGQELEEIRASHQQWQAELEFEKRDAYLKSLP